MKSVNCFLQRVYGLEWFGLKGCGLRRLTGYRCGGGWFCYTIAGGMLLSFAPGVFCGGEVDGHAFGDEARARKCWPRGFVVACKSPGRDEHARGTASNGHSRQHPPKTHVCKTTITTLSEDISPTNYQVEEHCPERCQASSWPCSAVAS